MSDAYRLVRALKASRVPEIQLNEAAVRAALPRLAAGLERYVALQAALARTDVAQDRAFQRAFNAFYRVRRGKVWQAAFYGTFRRGQLKRQTYGEVLRMLQLRTGRVEASFASKLVASLDPNMPVIDAFVLKNLGLRTSRNGTAEERLARTVDLHDSLRKALAGYLRTDHGRDLVIAFKAAYPAHRVTRMKMLDLVLWQIRMSPRAKRSRSG